MFVLFLGPLDKAETLSEILALVALYENLKHREVES